MRFIFPFSEIPYGSRIVIYGASQAGYDFYRQVKSTHYCEIIAWVDRQYYWWREMNLPVEPPENIEGKKYDYIVLSAEVEGVAESMKKDLLEAGVPGEKIFWKNDYAIRENIVLGYDAERVLVESKDAYKDNPYKYLNEETLDVVVRVLYAEDLIRGRDVHKHREMYKKLMMNQNDCCEPTEDMVHAYFTEYSMKRGWEAFDKSFCNLVTSIVSSGFDRRFFIPIDSAGRLINGRHRLAVAIAAKVPVWVRPYSYGGFHFHFNDEWLGQLGFNYEEIGEVITEYRRLKEEEE